MPVRILAGYATAQRAAFAGIVAGGHYDAQCYRPSHGVNRKEHHRKTLGRVVPLTGTTCVTSSPSAVTGTYNGTIDIPAFIRGCAGTLWYIEYYNYGGAKWHTWVSL